MYVPNWVLHLQRLVLSSLTTTSLKMTGPNFNARVAFLAIDGLNDQDYKRVHPSFNRSYFSSCCISSHPSRNVSYVEELVQLSITRPYDYVHTCTHSLVRKMSLRHIFSFIKELKLSVAFL